MSVPQTLRIRIRWIISCVHHAGKVSWTPAEAEDDWLVESSGVESDFGPESESSNFGPESESSTEGMYYSLIVQWA